MTLMTMADSPHSIGFGSAIGIFFGFTPLYPFKTLLSIAAAWICRCNKIAAAIAVTVHDILIFVMPAIYFVEYKLGCWILQRPTMQPARISHFQISDYLHWRFFFRVVWPALIGSLFIAAPSAIVTYFVMRMLVSRARPPASDS